MLMAALSSFGSCNWQHSSRVLSDNSGLLKNVFLLSVVQFVAGLHECITAPEILEVNVMGHMQALKHFNGFSGYRSTICDKLPPVLTQY